MCSTDYVKLELQSSEAHEHAMDSYGWIWVLRNLRPSGGRTLSSGLHDRREERDEALLGGTEIMAVIIITIIIIVITIIIIIIIITIIIIINIIVIIVVIIGGAQTMVAQTVVMGILLHD